MDYFESWDWKGIDDGEIWKWDLLMKQYKQADKLFDQRFEDNLEQDGKKFEEIIEELDAKWDDFQTSDDLKRFAYLTKGNVLLRKGQYLDERFLNPQDDFHQALALLEQGFRSGSSERINLLIQMNLGRYFRNMGRHGRRSDYLRALDEFRDVRQRMENMCAETGQKLAVWQTHLWLEATVNMGRVEKYLYHLQNAKKYFWEIVKILLPLYTKGGKTVENYLNADTELAVWWNASDSEDDLENPEEKMGWRTDLSDKMKETGTMELYHAYLRQALVQLGIVYRKGRDYDVAQKLCELVLEEFDKDNVDALNNLGVCKRKQVLKNPYRRDAESERKAALINLQKSQYFDQPYEEVFKHLKERKNRFATLNYYKCVLDKKEKNEKEYKKVIGELNEMLEKNPKDYELTFLKAMFYRKMEGKWEEAQEIFCSIYEASPYIRKGTIGLKAYYNRTHDFIGKKKFHQAKERLEKIIEECEEKKGVEQYLKDARPDYLLSEKDLLSEINLGWCLQQMGNYKEAKKLYQSILEKYKEDKTCQRLSVKNEMKIRNNLGECCLRLGTQDDVEEAVACLKEAGEREPQNTVTKRFLACGYMLQGKNCTDTAKKTGYLKRAKACFEEAALLDPNDIFVNSGWLETTALLLEQDNTNEKELAEEIEKNLKYSQGFYSMRACARFAEFVSKMENEKAFSEDRKVTLYRSLARVRIGEAEEGYQAFSRFLQDDVFRKTDVDRRGKILMYLFQLYGDILKIKDECRYTTLDKEKHRLPVHYTKVSTLKKLMEASADSVPRMRLWHTVYMNDSLEGEYFIKLLEQIGKKDTSEETQGNVKGILAHYFSHLDSSHTEKNLMVPANENTYVISFSTLKDAIHMWIPYADDAKGCSITFADSFFDIYDKESMLADVSCYSDTDYPLYWIQYLKEEKKAGTGKENTGEGDIVLPDKISEFMTDIWAQIKGLDKYLEEQDEQSLTTEAKSRTRTFAAGCLNEIRFLFKSVEYEYEKEVRMTYCSYQPKVDEQNFKVPRLFVEVERDIQIEEVELGSKIPPAEADALVSWLGKTGKVENITKSKRHYK